MSVRLRTQETLYDSGKIKVVYQPKPIPHYDVTLGKVEGAINRYTLENLAAMDTLTFEGMVKRVFNYNIKNVLDDEGLSLQEVHLALAQATVREMQHEKREAYFKEERRNGALV